MTLPEDELQQYEEQLQDVDEKTILIWQLAELTAIRQALTQESVDNSEPVYECKHCGETVSKDEREQHAESHNAPPGELPFTKQ